jgi:hypothetical protein
VKRAGHWGGTELQALGHTASYDRG